MLYNIPVMKNLQCSLSSIFLLISIICYSQVGINADNPSAMLDILNKVAGNKCIEINNSASEIVTVLDNGNLGLGTNNPSAQLNSTNTVKFSGIGNDDTNTKIMTTDGTGNVTTRATATLLPKVLAGSDGADAISVSQTISSINDLATYTSNLFIKSFTITQTSLVNFSYQLGAGNILDYNKTADITDGHAKQIGARLVWKTLPAGSAFAVNGIIHTNAMSFMNKTATVFVKGYYYPGGNSYVILPPGNYSVELRGYVYAYDIGQGISATFGGSPYDRLDVIAIPVQ
jgi:hypothetical protein